MKEVYVLFNANEYGNDWDITFSITVFEPDNIKEKVKEWLLKQYPKDFEYIDEVLEEYEEFWNQQTTTYLKGDESSRFFADDYVTFSLTRKIIE